MSGLFTAIPVSWDGRLFFRLQTKNMGHISLKEVYFQAETIDSVAFGMLDSVRALRDRHPSSFSPATSALLVLDMQKYFLDPDSHAYIPSASAIIPNILKLCDSFKKAGAPVYFTRHVNTAINAGRMADWWSDLLNDENPGSPIVDELSGHLHDSSMFVKSQYDAFHGTSLESELRFSEVKQVVITGVMTHLCCETTARSAFLRGFEVFFAMDGTATYNRKFHDATLLNLSHGFAHPVLCQEILDMMKESYDL